MLPTLVVLAAFWPLISPGFHIHKNVLKVNKVEGWMGMRWRGI